MSDPADAIDWIPSVTSKNYDLAPEPSQMLHWDTDVKPMLDTCMSKRDAAMIAVAWDSGVRSG